MIDRETLDVYDAKAADYANLTLADEAHDDLRSFLGALPAGGRVLDLGCGPGLFAGHMASAGLQVTAWDASAAMIELAQAHAGVSAAQKTFDDLDAVNLYDGIFANFSLLHAERTQVPRHINQIAEALRSGGVFHIGMKTGSGETRDSIGRRYAYFTADELEKMLTDAGLTVFYRNAGRDMGLSGEMADWASLQARKPA